MAKCDPPPKACATVCRPPVNYFPLFSEFGKSTKDFFTKGFQTNSFRIGIRDQMSKHIQATINGTHDLEKLEADGDFQVKLTCPFFPAGYVSTSKWKTSNIITEELTANGTFVKGLDIGLGGTYDVDKNSPSGSLRTSYKHELVTVEGNFKGGDPETNPMVIGGNFVTGYQDFAFGANYEFDISERQTKKYNVTASVVHAPIKLLATLENAEVIWAGALYKHNADLEIGINGVYKSEPESYVNLGTTVKYAMDGCTTMRAKVDSDKIVTLGLDVKIKPQATITMTAKLDGNKFSEGGHEVGLGFDFEAS